MFIMHDWLGSDVLLMLSRLISVKEISGTIHTIWENDRAVVSLGKDDAETNEKV